MEVEVQLVAGSVGLLQGLLQHFQRAFLERYGLLVQQNAYQKVLCTD